MKKYLLFTLAAFLLLILRPTSGWCAEDFEVMWEKDLSPEDFTFVYTLNEYHGNKIYALSSDVDNFLVYQDNYFSFKILELQTGNFVNRIVVDSSLWPEHDGISKMQLIDNKTKLAVMLKTGIICVYDTKTWGLIRKVNATGYWSNNGKYLLEPLSGYGGPVYDFETMKKIYDLNLEEDAGYSPTIQKILISDDGKRAACARLMKGWQQIPDAWICEVYDLEKQKQLFRYVAEKSSDIFINSDLSKLYLNGNEYDMNTGKFVATWGIDKSDPFRNIMSLNEKYMFGSGISRIWVDPLSKTVKQYIWYAGTLEAGCLDAGKDYFLALRNITDTSATILKLKINIDDITPVNDNQNKIEILYPNPTNNIVHISNIQVQNIKDINVSDDRGTNFSKKCNIILLPDGFDINLQRLIKGVYFVQVNTATISKTYKVIKN